MKEKILKFYSISMIQNWSIFCNQKLPNYLIPKMPKYSKDSGKLFLSQSIVVAVRRDFVRKFNQQRPSKHCIIVMI